MAIDINEPVKQGSDMVLNPDGEEQRLGTANEFDRQVGKGNLVSLPPNDNPYGDPNKPGFKEARDKAQGNK
jgi:hypothetical protein